MYQKNGIKLSSIILVLLIIGGVFAVWKIAYKFKTNKIEEKTIPVEEKKVEPPVIVKEIEVLPLGVKEYKNEELGISFRYPEKYEDIIFNLEKGDVGQRYEGHTPNYSYFSFSGATKDYKKENNYFAPIDFKGYIKTDDLAEVYGFNKSKVATKKMQEVIVASGARGILLQDIGDSDSRNNNNLITTGQTVLFFNLPKFNGGFKIVFNRNRVPEYMDIINSLIIK